MPNETESDDFKDATESPLAAFVTGAAIVAAGIAGLVAIVAMIWFFFFAAQPSAENFKVASVMV